MGLIRTMLREMLRPRGRARKAVSLEAAIVLVEQERLGEAEAALRELCVAGPDFEPRLWLGRVLYAQNKWGPASVMLAQALERDPASTDAQYLLGRARSDNGEYSDAAPPLRRVTELLPEWAPGWLALADALGGMGHVDEAEDAFLRALELAPHVSIASYNYANLLFQLGRVEEAIGRYRKAVELDPEFRRGHSNLLYALNFSEALAPEAVYRAHLAWAARFAEPLTVAAERPPAAARSKTPLRVGYVSPNFRDHAATYFFEPVLEHHDRSAFEIYCYSDVGAPDARTAKLRAYTSVWRETKALTDQALAQRVRDDCIDILVDLTGHTRGDRLLAFARRPAPVQITWNGYANTTGMSAIDYRITDGYADPPGATEALHTEKLMRMPEIYMPFARPLDDVPVGPSPSLARGHVTFGSFNTLSKVTPGVLRLWARVLDAVPTAQFLMLAVPQDRTRERIMQAFAAAGIDERRLDLRGRVTHGEFMAVHNEVDIALDSFPQAGTTTTAHTLWMGVPVVTLAGKTHAGRVGVSMLSNAGLAHLVAASEDDYVAIAARLAQDAEGLQALRAGLRAQVRNAPNMDGLRFTRFLESAYVKAWEDRRAASA